MKKILLGVAIGLLLAIIGLVIYELFQKRPIKIISGDRVFTVLRRFKLGGSCCSEAE